MTKRPAYLDHNATTPLKPEARAAVLALLDAPGNASSVHKPGRAARRIIEDARATVAKFVSAGPRAVVTFTSGATEANNLVLRGAGVERVLVSAIEHPSVLQARADAETIPVLADGTLDLAALDKMLDGNEEQTLLSVMLVNNETGVIQPLEAVMEIARKRGAIVHADAVQAAGRIPLDLQKLGVDFLTLSSHKIGGPQGAGCLINANCVALAPLLRGGHQEKEMRAGTENVAAIAGFAAATQTATPDLSPLRDLLETELLGIAPEARIFGKGAPRVGNTSMFAVRNLPAETQLIALDLAGICVSNGSACASGTVRPSHVLAAMGVAEDEAACALRVSLGWNSTEEDVQSFIAAWRGIYGRAKARHA